MQPKLVYLKIDKIEVTMLAQKLSRTTNALQFVNDIVASRMVGLDSLMNKMKILSAGSGRCVGELKVEEIHTSPFKTLHGGFVAALIDNVGTTALNTHEKINWRKNVSVYLHTIHLRPSKIGDVIHIDAYTVNVGKTLCNVEAVITDSISGKLLAKGTMSRYVLPSERDEDSENHAFK